MNKRMCSDPKTVIMKMDTVISPPPHEWPFEQRAPKTRSFVVAVVVLRFLSFIRRTD